MKRNFDAVVRAFDGRPHVKQVFAFDPKTGMPVIENGAHKFSHHEPMTLRLYALDALAGRWRGEESMTVEEAHQRMKLHDKLAFAKDGVVEIDGKEGQMILDCLLKQGREPIVVGRMKELIDTDPAPSREEGAP